MSHRGDKKKNLPTVTVTSENGSSSDDSSDSSSAKASSMRSPRTARFAEATAVNSPVDRAGMRRLPFAEPRGTAHFTAQPQVSDVGFGYVGRPESVEMPNTDNYAYPTTSRQPNRGPLKSAMKTPGAAPRDFGGILSPTFREEDLVEKAENHTTKHQKRDVSIKARVRLAKFFLRGVNFSCSLIVLSMLSATFTVFFSTKDLPSRNGLPPWADNQRVWPQTVLLVIACVSLLASMLVFYGYYRAGHKGGSKYNHYYQYVMLAWFGFSVGMWLVGASVLQSTRDDTDKKNMWGWACNQNERRQLFQKEVSYDIICRLENWSLLCCIIEVVVETITIGVYIIAFYRIYSKTQLRKAMATRDRARSDLWKAQLRHDTAPPTPGFNIPYSAREDLHDYSHPIADEDSIAEDAEGVQYIDADQKMRPAPFKLQAPPLKGGATPMIDAFDDDFDPIQPVSRARDPLPPVQQMVAQAPAQDDERSPFLSPRAQHFQFPMSPGLAPDASQTEQEHFDAAPGERVYESVPIPGAYEAPLSPGVEMDRPQPMFFGR